MNNVRLLSLGVLALGVSAAGLVGCGSSSGDGGSSALPASSSTASGGASSTPASGKPIDVCAALPAASAAKLSGAAFTTANPITNLQPQEYGCAYSNDADSVQAEIKVFAMSQCDEAMGQSLLTGPGSQQAAHGARARRR